MFTSPHSVLVDSAFFFALFHSKDNHHEEAIEKESLLDGNRIIVPWPILYETINSRFVTSPEMIREFEKIMRRPHTKLDDSKYREEAYEDTLALAKRGYKRGYGAISLVDSVLHAILKDINVRISAMLTFDDRDFRRICASRKIKIL